LTTTQLVAAVILKASGETSEAVSGDSDWLKTLGIANQCIDDFSNEPNVDWNSLYDPEYSIGTVSATASYDLDLDTIRKISDAPHDLVRIDHLNGQYTNYQVVPAESLKRYYTGNKASSVGYYCAQIGNTLVFNHAFISTDAQFGGDIKIPVYLYPEHLVGDSDTVPVDIPNWLVYAAAAEWTRNDVTKQNLYPGLLSQANAIMQRMKDDNETAQVETVLRVPVARGSVW